MINEELRIGNQTIHNRVVFQPMEGCDSRPDGGMGVLTVKRYERFASCRAGIIWMEANAVCKEGKANPHQMSLTQRNLDEFKREISKLKEISLKENGFESKIILQLTHSGRHGIRPVTIYRNGVYEINKPSSDEETAADEYLDMLPDLYADAAGLAMKAGFDGADVKCCHGYLLSEALSAFKRKGRYGGCFDNRARLFLNCAEGAKSRMESGKILTSRLGVYDGVPYPEGFGCDENNNVDLTEPKSLIRRLQKYGVGLLNITVGNPYYNPHVNRPFDVGAYKPPESQAAGLKRFYDVTKELKESFPEIKFVVSGLTYYKKEVFKASERMLSDGVCDLLGFGRLSLAYPEFYKDYSDGCFKPEKCCLACSKCSRLMREKSASGCAVFDRYYRNLYKEKVLCASHSSQARTAE